MRILRAFALCVAVASLTVLAQADEPKSPGKEKKTEPDPVSLLVGKWQGTGKFAGVMLEYTKDGKHISTAVLNPGAKPTVVTGIWKLKGDQLTQTLGSIKATTTITKLTEKEFHFKNNAGQEATYERVPEMKK